MYTPIAKRAIGIDPETELAREIYAWKEINDAKTETISVIYDVVLMLPNGKVASILRTGEYRRSNVAGNMKFDQMRADIAGQRIAALIQLDLDNVQSYETIEEDLKQAIIPAEA